jgi:hypothetical protein
MSAGHTAKGQLQRACLEVIGRYGAAGELPTSTRFIYYDLKQAGYPLKGHDARHPDQDVIDAVKHLRDAGLVPWNWILDETRSVEVPITAPTITQWLIDGLDRARISPWPEGKQPVIICESRGVRAALRATARRYGAQITSTNGQAGGFLHTDVAPEMTWVTPVAYFGDWNPSGSMIEANTRRVLERETTPGRPVSAVLPLTWERLAVTPELVEQYNAAHPDRPLPPKPGTDKRYADGNPHQSYECEALGVTELNRLLESWLDGLLPEPLADVQERERAQREELRELLERRSQ